ncbi:MAG: hypothetical protein MUF22_01415, partial [Chitinispirillaceae bacterium]|nr:hypothetical protein [Chitinispirillaceae bacterium]
MKRVCLIAVCAFAAAGMLSPIRAERPVKLLQCKIGTAWPGELRGSGGVTGVLDFAYGRIVDKKVGFGISGSFLWESTSTDSTVGDRIKKMWNEETYMLPVMGFVELDPIPDRIVHPIARFSIGYNSMI